MRRFVSTTDKPEQVVEEESRSGQALRARSRLTLGAGRRSSRSSRRSCRSTPGSRAPLFYESFNLNNILLSALPLVWIAIGQQFALLVGELDISIGATTTLSVVLASFLLDTGSVGGIVIGVRRDHCGRGPRGIVQLAC